MGKFCSLAGFRENSACPQILNSRSQPLGRILKMPQTDITGAAEQSANFIRFVAMIDMQCACRDALTNLAAPILRFAHFIILGWRDPKLAKEIAAIFPIIAMLVVPPPLAQAAHASAIGLQAQGGFAATTWSALESRLRRAGCDRKINRAQTTSPLALSHIAHYSHLHCSHEGSSHEAAAVPMSQRLFRAFFTYRKVCRSRPSRLA